MKTLASFGEFFKAKRQALGLTLREFCVKHKTSSPTIYNMMSKLRKLNILIKDDDKGIKVNPLLVLDFNKPIQLNISISHDS